MELLIQNVRRYDNGQTVDILIEGDRVTATQAHIEVPASTAVLDGRGLTAAPGLVDMHVHLRDPGQTHKEDMASACRAAAAGGVTGLLAMPNTAPTVDNPEVVRDILARAKTMPVRVYQSAAITRGLKSEEPTDWAALQKAGAIALSDDGRPVEDTKVMARALTEAQKLGLRVVSHCEDLYLAKGGLIHEGVVSEALGVPGVPAAAEDAGTARDIALAAAYNVPVHICHVSTATSVALIRDAKGRGIPVTAETAPHYLLLTEESLRAQDADFRMNPPLRTETDRKALIEALCDGTIDCIATDHAPHTPEEKSDFRNAPNGAIGMETSLAAAYTALVKSGHMDFCALIRLMSERPARILGISAGHLEVGDNADLILVDTGEVWMVEPERLHGKSRNTPFKGMELTGKVKVTLCRGRVVFDDRDAE